MADEVVEMLRDAAREALPPLEGELRVDGLGGPVEVRRDRWGVPHISASNLHDLFLAQGFVAASDRYFQIELLMRYSTGQLCELIGALTMPLDRFIRTLGWPEMAARHVAGWDQESRDNVSAFWSGIAAWGSQMPAPPVEYAILEADPWVPTVEEGCLATAGFALLLGYTLTRNWDAELLRAEVAERLGVDAMLDLFPDVQNLPAFIQAGKSTHPARTALLAGAHLPTSGQGSNEWVVAGERSATGKPLLANDPHLAILLPAMWYECDLRCPGFHAAGASLPFAPGIVIGHNDHIAWGVTDTESDVSDLYLERISDDGTAAEYNGAWEPLRVRTETIKVRDGDDVVLDVKETRHGPLLDSYLIGIADPASIEGGITKAYALRWTASQATVQPLNLTRVNTAANWEQFRAALHGWECPALNFVYADVDGNIGYQLWGRHPVRRNGDGTVPVPGWTDQYEWVGDVPSAELPWAFNPSEGFLANANNKAHHDSYPHLLSGDFLPPFRVMRIAELLCATETHSLESFAAIQNDTRSPAVQEVLPYLLEVAPADERQKQALGLLAEWDHDLAASSAPAAIFEAWCNHLARNVLLPRLGKELFVHFHGRRQWTNAFEFLALPTMLAYPSARWFGADGVEARDKVLRAALDAALDDITERLGDDVAAWRWGALHTATFTGQLGMVPGLEELLTGGVVEMGGNEQTVAQSLHEPDLGYKVSIVPSWRQLLDVSDWDASLGSLPGGQSENPTSPHYNDLLGIWAKGGYHPLPFSEAAVEAATVARLRLAPPA
ncbi:MAG TPA: penicillin acylase family protein [Actinomycetota bacterium]|nr:penicillin acylase family protein [Actinomycetota bacterium]